MKITPEYRKKYNEKVKPALVKELGYSNEMEIPQIVKVSLNRRVGEAVTDKKLVDKAVEELEVITGQKAVPTYARKSISNFKLREGMPIGAKVTLRGNIMWEFIERFISIVLPRVRDFKGISDKGFDGRGNFSVGITESIVFPEINLDKVGKITGLDVTIVTTAKTDNEAYHLLKEIGFPFKNQND